MSKAGNVLVTATKLRQVVTNRAFVRFLAGLALAGLAQAGMHISPTVRNDVLNILSGVAPVAWPAYEAARDRLRKRTAVTPAPAEDGACGASAQQ